MTTRCRGAMGECGARTQGAPIAEAMGVTEDAAARRPARPGGPCFVSLGALSGLAALGLVAAALLSAGSAAASLEPLPRTYGGLTIPRVTAVTAHIPPRARRTRVIVTLCLPPLAQTDLARRFSSPAGATRKLNVASASSRRYLARLDAAQRRAIGILGREIPEARVSSRFRIVLDGFKGDGVKVAVVDDGIDERNPFFVGSGLAVPAGFPKGNSDFTNEKVIVARSFPGPGSGPEGRLPLDPRVSFHGTHVAGIIAGNENTTAPDSTVIAEERTAQVCLRAAGGCIPRVTGLSGVAPRAWLGNYRVFSVKDPLTQTDCCVANTPEIAAAFEAAVADGMDVINFSGGGTQADPASDALIAAVANVAKAGVVPVISAGNDRDLFGFGTVGSPSTAPDAISVAAVTNAHVFTPALSVLSPAVPSLRQIPYVAAPGITLPAWGTDNQTLVDVGAIVGTNGHPVDRTLCADTLPANSLVNLIALVSSGGCRFETKGSRAAAAGAEGGVGVDNHLGEG